MDEAVATFQAITAQPNEVCRSYIEMAGGSLDLAVSIFMDNNGGDGFGSSPAGACAASAAASADKPPWWHVVWPASTSPDNMPAAWSEQALQFGQGGCGGGSSSSIGFNLPQPLNGPCGVLAAYHGLVGAECFHNQPGLGTAAFTPSDAMVVAAIVKLLLRARPDGDGSIILVSWADKAKGEDAVVVVETSVEAIDATAAVTAALPSFYAKGGVLLLVYSAVSTRYLIICIRTPPGQRSV